MDDTKIIAAEAKELEDMEALFTKKFNPEIKGQGTIIEGIELFKKVLCGFTAKENAIAAVIFACAKLEASVKGIDPCKLCCCKCHCNNTDCK